MELHYHHEMDNAPVSGHKDRSNSFVTSFNSQLQATFQNRRNRYDSIDVLLTSWEDDHALDTDIENLRFQFTNTFCSTVEWFKIPREDSGEALRHKVEEIGEDFERDSHLFIFYYGGGAGLEARKDPIWRPADSDTPHLRWLPIQALLEKSDRDVLLILDCNYGSVPSRNRDGEGYSAFTQDESADERPIHGKTEILAAPQLDHPPTGPSTISFTHAIGHAFEKLRDGPFTVNQLHVNLIGMQGLAATPVYLNLSAGHQSSIRFPPPSEEKDPARKVHLDVLLRRRLSVTDLESLVEWMKQAPPHVGAPRLRATDLRLLPYDSTSAQASGQDQENLSIIVPLHDSLLPDEREWKAWLGIKAPSVVRKVEVNVQTISETVTLGADSGEEDPLSTLVTNLNLNEGITKMLASRSDRYSKVSLLPLLWENGTPDLVGEMEDLRAIFIEYFNYNVEPIWYIPAKRSDYALEGKVFDFCREHDKNDELVIVAYGGHGVNTYYTDEPTSRWAQVSDGGPTLDWSPLQKRLQASFCDAAIILNCCYAGTAALAQRQGTNYILAACDYQNVTYAGPDSYIKILNQELKKLAEQKVPFTLKKFGEQIEAEAIVRKNPRPYHKTMKDPTEKWAERQIYLTPSEPATSKDVNLTAPPQPKSVYAKFTITHPESVDCDEWESFLQHPDSVTFYTREMICAELKKEKSF